MSRPFRSGQGDNPCNEDCPLDWAASAFDQPIADPKPMMLPPGTLCYGMSYAKEGVPYKTSYIYELEVREPGVGYKTERGIMFRFDGCGNWSVCKQAVEVPASLYSMIINQETTTPSFALTNPPFGSSRRTVTETHEFPPPVIPLPPSILMLVSAFALLWWIKR